METKIEIPEATEIAARTNRLAQITMRLFAVSARSQSHALRKATGDEYSLMDGETLALAYGTFFSELMADPQKLFEHQLKAGTAIWSAWQGFLSGGGAEATSKDRRFKDESWSTDPLSRSYRDVFLAFEGAVNEMLDDLPKDSKDHLRVSFYTRQMLSSLSPANFLATNSGARNSLMESNGESLLAGLENLLEDLERGDGRLDIETNDTGAFEVGKDLGTTEGQVVYQNDLMQLIQYAPRTEKQHATPILFVPAWINKFYILDMQPKNSLVKYMLERGHSVFVISWVNPTREHAEKDFGDYMKDGPLTALDVIRDITKQEKANILGFCIGGILVTATMAYLAAKGDDRIAAATTLATMVDFKNVGEIGVFVDENRLKIIGEHMAEKGYLEAHHLQDMFSMLRENDLIWSFHESRYLRGNKPRPFDLLFWNSDATRLPSAMLMWYLKSVYIENKLREPEGLELNGVRLDLSKIKTPCFVLATQEDHIAPWRSIYPSTQLFGGEVEFVLGGSGHIAGVINPPAERPKYGYRISTDCPPTPDEFLEQASRHEGSWWPHWAEWLEEKETKTVPARKIAKRGKYKAIEPAPGSYVVAP